MTVFTALFKKKRNKAFLAAGTLLVSGMGVAESSFAQSVQPDSTHLHYAEIEKPASSLLKPSNHESWLAFKTGTAINSAASNSPVFTADIEANLFRKKYVSAQAGILTGIMSDASRLMSQYYDRYTRYHSNDMGGRFTKELYAGVKVGPNISMSNRFVLNPAAMVGAHLFRSMPNPAENSVTGELAKGKKEIVPCAGIGVGGKFYLSDKPEHGGLFLNFRIQKNMMLSSGNHQPNAKSYAATNGTWLAIGAGFRLNHK